MEYNHLEAVKEMIGITGEYQDQKVKNYINEVIAYMIEAGVRKDVANGATAIGVVARGVDDIWNHNSGEVKLSQYFKERVIQLVYKQDEEAET